MRKYQKITLEVEITVLKDKEISEGQIKQFNMKAKRGLKDALILARISHGGIKLRTIIDAATLDEVNKIQTGA